MQWELQDFQTCEVRAGCGNTGVGVRRCTWGFELNWLGRVKWREEGEDGRWWNLLCGVSPTREDPRLECPSPTDGQAQVQLLNGQLDSEPKALSSTGDKPQRAHSTAQDSPVIRAEHGDLGYSDSKRLGWQSTVKRNNRSVIETKRRKRS